MNDFKNFRKIKRTIYNNMTEHEKQDFNQGMLGIGLLSLFFFIAHFI